MKLHPTSSAVTRMEMFFHDVRLGSATGFVYSFGQDLALVSNWHVFSGRHPETQLALDTTGYTPNRVEFHLSVWMENDAGVSIDFRGVDLPLVKEDQPLWWQHKGYVDPDGHAHHVDIGVLPLANVTSDFAEIKESIGRILSHMVVMPADRPEDWRARQGTAPVGSEVFVLGYPLGLANQGVIPVWKRGSIASEPLFEIQGNIPIIYVDALTRHGMSGSPVLFFGPEVVDETGIPVTAQRSNYEPWLVGVYAGRRVASKEELEMALGRVWKKELLDQIFFQRIPGGQGPVA